MAIDYESIGKRIKHYRTQKKLSQEELGKAVFATPVHISYIETGARTPSLEILILIANALDVSADDLLRDNLEHSSSPVGMDCNEGEKAILTKTLTFLKNLLGEYGI